MTKCPNCDKQIAWVNMEPVDAMAALSNKRHALILSCPNCQVALGASLDPVSLNTDLVDAILARLRAA